MLSSLTLMTNVFSMFVHGKETFTGRSNMSWQRSLPNRKQKTAPTSSQPQTAADLKHSRRHYCMLFSLGLPSPRNACWATPKCHKLRRQHRGQSVLSHHKDFLLLIMLRLWSGGGVMGGDRGRGRQHETTGRNVKPQQVVSLSMGLL